MATKSKWQRKVFFPENPTEKIEDPAEQKEAFEAAGRFAKNKANRFARAKRARRLRVRVIRKNAITLILWRIP